MTPNNAIAAIGPDMVPDLVWSDDADYPKAKGAFGFYKVHRYYAPVELYLWDEGSFNVSLGRIQLEAGASIDDLKDAAQAALSLAASVGLARAERAHQLEQT